MVVVIPSSIGSSNSAVIGNHDGQPGHLLPPLPRPYLYNVVLSIQSRICYDHEWKSWRASD